MKHKLRQNFAGLWILFLDTFSSSRQPDHFDTVMPSAPDIMTSPPWTNVRNAVRVKVGEPIQVRIVGHAKLDRKSASRERRILDICVGVRFTDGFGPQSTDGPNFYGWEGDQPLSEHYRLLNGATCTRTFAEATVPRGGVQTLEHSLTFTYLQAGEVTLQPLIVLTDEQFRGSFFGAGVTPKFLFG